jgi:hypothetical protein
MRRLIPLSALAAAVACAGLAPPPGGPEDRDPPRIVSRTPDSAQTNVQADRIEVVFDNVIAEPPRRGGSSGLEAYVLVSPDPGDVRVEWHRSRITIEPRGGLRPNTAYRVTILPGITDLRNNATREPISWLFATGAEFPPHQIQGRIFDWTAEAPAGDAVIQARIVAGADTLTYVGASDSVGRFAVGPLPPGTYDVRGFLDANRNRRLDPREKVSQTIQLQASTPSPLELLAIDRDTTPPKINAVDVLDSVTVRVLFDRAIDPVQLLQPALVRVQRADSTELTVREVVTEAQEAAVRRARADSAAATDTTNRPRPAAPPTRPAAATDSAPPRPSLPAPAMGIVLRLEPGSVIAMEQEIRVTARAIRGITGTVLASSQTARRNR